MIDGRGISGGRLPRGSILAEMKSSSTPHGIPGLAIRLSTRGFTSGGHRDSSLYRNARIPLNV
jgi:hypothetical protein